MSNFPIVATVLAMILGLSVTRLLMGALTVFRIRRVAAPDWVALVWAVMLFTSQLDFWWAVNALPTIKQPFRLPSFYCWCSWRSRFLSLPRYCCPVEVRTSKAGFAFTSNRMGATPFYRFRPTSCSASS